MKRVIGAVVLLIAGACGEPVAIVETDSALLPGEQPGYCAANHLPVAGFPAGNFQADYTSGVVVYGTNQFNATPATFMMGNQTGGNLLRHVDNSGGQFASCAASFTYRLYDGPGQPADGAYFGCQTYAVNTAGGNCRWSNGSVTSLPADNFYAFRGQQGSVISRVVQISAQPPVGALGKFYGKTH